MRVGRLGRMAAIAFAAACLVALVPGPSQARPFDHVAVGNGSDGFGNRLAVTAYDSLAGSGGSAVYRAYLKPGPAITIEFDCVAIQFIPTHFLHASGKGSDGNTYYVGVFDDTAPLGRGPYDAISVTTTRGSGPCGTSAPYPTNWYPVAAGDYFVGP